MSDNKDKKRIAPPADALERLATAVKNAPNHPAVRTWADVIRQGWPDFRDLVLKRKYRATDVAGMLQELFQREFDEDYLRRLLLAEATARLDKKMLKALGKSTSVNAKPAMKMHGECSAAASATKHIVAAKKKSIKTAKDIAAGGAEAQTAIKLDSDGKSAGSAEEVNIGQSQIKERIRRMHGG